MKKLRRQLALLLCALLLASGFAAAQEEIANVNAPTWMEETEAAPKRAPDPAESAAVEARPAATAAMTPAPTARPAPAETATPAPTAQPTPNDAPKPTPRPTPMPAPADPSAQAAPSAAEQTDFERGYARVQGDVPGYAGGYPGAELDCYLTSGGVVYALERRRTSDCDRLLCALDDGAAERRVWIDAKWLRPLDSEASQAFIAERLAAANARRLAGEGLPLDRVDCASAISFKLSDDAPAPEELPAMLLERDRLELGEGEATRLRVGFSDGGDYELSFMSQNSRIATVSDSGEVRARRAGDTVITIRNELGGETSIRVAVIEAPDHIRLRAARDTLGVGEELSLSVRLPANAASALRFESSDPAVISVDARGMARAISPGTAQIRVQTYNGCEASVELEVCSAPERLFLEPRLELNVGERYTFELKLFPAAVGARVFTSDNPAVLEVQPGSGHAFARAEGTARVSVTLYNGLSASCDVRVHGVG